MMITAAVRWRDEILRRQLPGGLALSWAVSLGVVVAISLIAWPLRDVLPIGPLSAVYVTVLFVTGLAFGTAHAVASAVFAFLVSDVLLYPPYYSLWVDTWEHVLGLTVFLVISVGSGWMGGHLRAYAQEAMRDSRRTALLYDLNRALITDVTLDQLLTTIVRGVVDIYGAQGSRLLVPDDAGAGTAATAAAAAGFTVAARWPEVPDPVSSRQTLHLARHALDEGVVTGLGAAGRIVHLPHGVAEPARRLTRRSGTDVLYVPVGPPLDRVGVLEVTGRPGGGPFHPEDERVLVSFADQAALAVQRATLIGEATRVEVLEESNALKSAMLSAVSHDLRTPLAAIRMSASALRDPAIDWDDASRHDLLQSIEESSDWLARVIDNFLDLSRIEGGALRPDRDWLDLDELLHHVLMRMEPQIAGHAVTLDLPDDLPLVSLDYVQIAQVLTNVIGNAAKYSPEGSAVTVAVCTRDDRELEIRVTDRGPGISSASLPFIFDSFYRARPETGPSGSGVGLAISRGLVEAHGGRISAESAVGVGTTIRIRLPLEEST